MDKTKQNVHVNFLQSFEQRKAEGKWSYNLAFNSTHAGRKCTIAVGGL